MKQNEIDRLGILTSGDAKAQKTLLGISKEVEAFEYDGLIVKGNRLEIITRYCRLNPLKKFRVWLIDNCVIY